MFDVFNYLHDNRKSDSIPYFSFYDNDGKLIRGSIDVSIDDNGQFDVVTQILDGETYIYTSGNFTYTVECLYVLGIGFLLPGDIVKLKIDADKKYELNFGWHTNISGQSIYSWYLVPVKQEDYFYEQRNGIFNSTDLAEMNIESNGILTLYKELLDTIEVVEFRKDRVFFNKK